MAKFKLRLFQSCRSKDDSTLPLHPNPITVDTTKQLHRSSFKSHVSSAFGCGSKSGDHSDSECFQWQEDDQWHVVAKIYDVESPRKKIYNSSVSGGDTDDDVLPLPLLPPDKKKRRRRKVKTQTKTETETETETLISTDSSTDFNPQLETIRENASVSLSNRYKVKKKKSTPSKRNGSPEWGSPARLSVFKKMIPGKVVEGKMKESFAVVKRSEDPYEDFKRSMMEMIIEKQMFEKHDLEQLLQCFLSLNSRFHHALIVEAFSEIWETMFGSNDRIM